MKDIYWTAVKAITMQEFANNMSKIIKISEVALGYLLDLKIEYWSRQAWSARPKLGLLLNNPFECFNSFVGGENKEKLILTTLKVVRKKLILRIHQKRDKMMKYNGLICPKIQKKFQKAKHKTRHWTRIPNGCNSFQLCRGKVQFLWT